MRRRLISRRGHLVRQMVREKNQVHAVLQRQLRERPPMTDMFGVKGRVWLASQQEHLPVDEQQSVNACLRQIDFVKKEIELVDVEIAKQVLASEDIRRLMTLPGVSGSPRPRSSQQSVMYRGSRRLAISSGISGSAHACTSQVQSLRSTDASASKDPARSADSWSRLPGTPPELPGRCARFISASRPGAARTSRR